MFYMYSNFTNKHEQLSASMDTPVLIVMIDTEEEFSWSTISRENTSTKSIKSQIHAHEIFDQFDVIPTYFVDYPVANSTEASSFLKEMRDNNKCEIGAHLHPWVNPPHEEEVSVFNSFHGNLPFELEQKKIKELTKIIEHAFDIKPTMFKAGRYGIGPNTIDILKQEGYLIDSSYVPYTSFQHSSGPSFLGVPDQPFWIDEENKFLEVPLSKNFYGILSRFGLGPAFQSVYDNPVYNRWHIPGILSRLGLTRCVLSPEGMTLNELQKLMDSMIARGKKVFCLTYHSPSLAPGNTPYVKTKEDLELFLATIRKVLEYFRKNIKGKFISTSQLYCLLQKNKKGYDTELPSI